jgi:hypothetical protein
MKPTADLLGSSVRVWCDVPWLVPFWIKRIVRRLYLSEGWWVVARVGRWWVAGIMTVAVFAVTVWILAAYVLSPMIGPAGDRWVVATGAGTSAAALAALWGQWWAARADTETSDKGGKAMHPHDAYEDRSVTAGGDITGIASTGDDASNIQRR